MKMNTIEEEVNHIPWKTLLVANGLVLIMSIYIHYLEIFYIIFTLTAILFVISAVILSLTQPRTKAEDEK